MNDERSTKEYKLWREKVFLRWGSRCFFCNKTENLHVHHVYSFARFPALKLDINNGQVLCEKCHLKHVHGIKIDDD